MEVFGILVGKVADPVCFSPLIALVDRLPGPGGDFVNVNGICGDGSNGLPLWPYLVPFDLGKGFGSFG